MKNKIISDNERSIYKYGAEITISTMTGILAVLVIGGILGNIFESVMFLLCFISIRAFSGGYHADTYIKCNLGFIAVFITVIYFSRIDMEQFGFAINIILLGISLLAIAILSPIENKNKPLYGSEKAKYKKISIFLSFLWSVVLVLLFLIGVNIVKVIAITMFSITILMVVEILKQKFTNRKGCNHER